MKTLVVYFWLITLCLLVVLELAMKLPSDGLRMYEKWSLENREKNLDIAALTAKLLSLRVVEEATAKEYAQKLYDIRENVVYLNNVTKQELEALGVTESERIASMFKHSIFTLKDENNGGGRSMVYIGEVDGKGRRAGRGLMKFANGSTYNGYFANNKRNGFGTFIDADGSKYVGNWKDDRRNGEGIAIDSRGVILTLFGKWHEDALMLTKFTKYLLHSRYWGNVLMRHSDGCTYFGEWKNSMMNGFGRYYNPDGSIFYEGEWKNDVMHGKGVSYYEYHGVKEYEGDFRDGLANGKGIHYYEHGGKQYEGDFVDSLPDGKGVIYSNDGTKVYEGELKEDKSDGEGIFYDEDGNKQYQGQFKEGVRNGKGVVYNSQGQIVFRGVWKNGAIVSQEES